MRAGFTSSDWGSNTMSEHTGETVEPQQPATGETDPTIEDTLGEAGKKANAAERDARNAAEKALREAQERISAFEQEKMRDMEPAQAAATERQQKEQAATAETLRYRIATEHGITAEDAETFLTATDEDGLTRQAERLKALAKPSGIPIPDPTQGARGNPIPASTAHQFAAAVQAAFD